jgi:hypothetical protein
VNWECGWSSGWMDELRIVRKEGRKGKESVVVFFIW